jgi:hypothetical protein
MTAAMSQELIAISCIASVLAEVPYLPSLFDLLLQLLL